MCYDISFTVNMRQLSDYFPDLIFDSQLNIDFGGFDHTQGPGVFGEHPVIYENIDDKKLHCKLMEWSVLEFYQKEKPPMVKRNGMLNIRSERILDDPKSYWYKIRSKRCLIPLAAIYEHREIKGWKKKVPYWVRPCDQPIIFLPGLYSVANLLDKETGKLVETWTFGLITRAANEVMKNIHNSGDNRHRMPLFLTFEMSKEYVSSNLSDQRYREILNYEMPSESLSYHPVYTIRSAKARPDDKPKNEIWEWDKLPELGVLNPD